LLKRLAEGFEKVLTARSLGGSGDSLDVELRQHSRTIATADQDATFPQAILIADDTILVFQDSIDPSSSVRRAKVRFLEDAGAFDHKLPSYDHIKIDKVQESINKVTLSTDKPSSFDAKKADLDDMNSNLELLKADHKALESHFTKASESTILQPEWIAQLSTLQRKTALDTEKLQIAISDAHLETCKRASHFHSDYYRLIDLQDLNRKKREDLKDRAIKIEKRNEKIKKLCRFKLDSIVKDANDPHTIEKISKHNSEIEQYLKIYKNDAKKVSTGINRPPKTSRSWRNNSKKSRERWAKATPTLGRA
jgi:hypothetical protein